jgi:hypothetical protein
VVKASKQRDHLDKITNDFFERNKNPLLHHYNLSRHGETWTKAEDESLTNSFSNWSTHRAKAHSRTTNAIRYRLRDLNLI